MRTRRELDEEARAFALGLIKRWIDDPSNVRLLRIGLDLWPDVEVLKEVLELLRPFTEKGGLEKHRREWPGTAFPKSCERARPKPVLFQMRKLCHPAIDLAAYRNLLRDEAVRLVDLPAP